MGTVLRSTDCRGLLCKPRNDREALVIRCICQGSLVIVRSEAT